MHLAEPEFHPGGIVPGAGWVMPDFTWDSDSQPSTEPVDIVDRIDELVNDQLASYSHRSGYDHNVNQDKCWHCGRDWHGLKITKRMEQMRQFGAYDEDYRYADDDSAVVCHGSEFIGPMKHPPRQQFRRPWGLGEAGISVTVQSNNINPFARAQAAVERMLEGILSITGPPPQPEMISTTCQQAAAIATHHVITGCRCGETVTYCAPGQYVTATCGICDETFTARNSL